MTPDRFPGLANLMGAWFNQDYDFDGEDEAATIDDYVRSSHAGDLAATRDEIDAFLAMPTAGLLDRFIAETGFGNMLIADDDAGARRWLANLRDRLAEA